MNRLTEERNDNWFRKNFYLEPTEKDIKEIYENLLEGIIELKEKETKLYLMIETLNHDKKILTSKQKQIVSKYWIAINKIHSLCNVLIFLIHKTVTNNELPLSVSDEEDEENR